MFLKASGALAGAGVLLGLEGRRSPAEAATTYSGARGYSMAMHVHSSFSEFSGSMEAQLFQAQKNRVNVLWWTEHDHRMTAFNYRNVVHFTSLTKENTDGPAWKWQERRSGSLASLSTGGIGAIGSPVDPIPNSSLSLVAQSKSASPATLGFYAHTNEANLNERANLYGQTWTLEVLPTSIGKNGYLELLITTSYHLATKGRPAGIYSLSYRFGGAGAPGTRSANGLLGIVNVPVKPGQWNTVTITPCNDIAAIWPDMDYRDFSSDGITLNAVSTGLGVIGNFDYLRFSRQHTSGIVPLQTEHAMETAYAAKFPRVVQRQGLEMGPMLPHVNWFGGAINLPSYAGVTASNYEAHMSQQIANCHKAGGLTSYNHPYGSSGGPPLPQSAQNSMMSHVATALLNNKALGTDIIEVGYVLRAGADLKHHLGLWDILSRNALFLTGNGVSDDHIATDWAGIRNSWVTSAWASSTSESDLLAALKAGRAWTGSLRHPCTLDLLADNSCPMGAVSVSTLPKRQLRVFATGIPKGGRLQVLRGTVDYAGKAAPVPNAEPVASFSIISGSATVVIDTTTSCFVRTSVLDATGAVVAVSNPIWMLRHAPSSGIPSARAC